MQKQEDVLKVLAEHEDLSTFQFRELLGIYPRSILNSILEPLGMVDKFMRGRNVHWKITEKGKHILIESEIRNETDITPEMVEEITSISKEIGVIEDTEEEKVGWLKRLRNRRK